MQPPARVVVFVDYQNAHLGALGAFWPAGTPRARGHLNPRALGELLVKKRTANKLASELVQVRVYRGRADPTRHPAAAAASDRQADAWLRLDKVHTIRRPLRYPRNWPTEPAQEKGIDVALAVDLVRLAIEDAYDVGVVVSADTDLLPGVEAVVELRAAHIEVAAWRGQPRFELTRRPRRVWCHWIGEHEYRGVADLADYSTRSRHR